MRLAGPPLTAAPVLQDRILKEERKYILDMCKKVQKSGCNVLLIQKSILRDAVNDLSLHFLAKMKILVVKDIERDDVEFICKTCGCLPIANIDTFHPEKLGRAELVHEVSTGDGKIVRVTGVPNEGKTVTILCKERAAPASRRPTAPPDRPPPPPLCRRPTTSCSTSRSARCTTRSACCAASSRSGSSRRAAAPRRCGSRTSSPSGPTRCSARARRPSPPRARPAAARRRPAAGMHSYCVRAFAEAMEVVPYTLAENAGLDAIHVVTELRNKHAEGEKAAGINVRKGKVTNILEENVLVPLLVHTSAVSLATECVRLILKIDDIVITR